MLLFTIANENDYEIKTKNGYYLKKVDYTKEEYEAIINEAKKYYYSYRVESFETDMSDNYHSDNTYYYSITFQNVLVKDKKFYGAITNGLGKRNTYYLVATIDNNVIDDSEVNGYNSIDRTYKLLPYKLDECTFDLPLKYYVTVHVITTRIKDGKEELFSDNTYYEYPLAFDVIVKENKAVGIKARNLEFIIDDPSTHIQTKIKEDFAGYKYIQKEEYRLVKYIND